MDDLFLHMLSEHYLHAQTECMMTMAILLSHLPLPITITTPLKPAAGARSPVIDIGFDTTKRHLCSQSPSKIRTAKLLLFTSQWRLISSSLILWYLLSTILLLFLA